MRHSVLFSELAAPELRRLADESTIVIVPVAAIEQHGPHLPAGTDTMLTVEVATRAARKLSGRPSALVTECVWSGLSEHHMAFGATISQEFPAFFALLQGIVGSLERHGFRKILLLNGHGGNIAALQTVVEQLSMASKASLVTATYWRLAQHKLAPLLTRQSGIRHAGEAETAMMMALRPDLVDASKLEEADCPDPRDVDQLPDDGYRWQSFADKTPSGALGVPSAATAEQGEKLLQTASDYLAERLCDGAFWGIRR